MRADPRDRAHRRACSERSSASDDGRARRPSTESQAMGSSAHDGHDTTGPGELGRLVGPRSGLAQSCSCGNGAARRRTRVRRYGASSACATGPAPCPERRSRRSSALSAPPESPVYRPSPRHRAGLTGDTLGRGDEHGCPRAGAARGSACGTGSCRDAGAMRPAWSSARLRASAPRRSVARVESVVNV
jgi:hypothetical protein